MGINNIIPKNLWKDKDSQKLNLSQKLVYRSQLLGADLQVTNFGGGNTSSKLLLKDPLSNKLTKVMLVKGSGGDLGAIKLDGFSSLYMDKFLSLKDKYNKETAYLISCGPSLAQHDIEMLNSRVLSTAIKNNFIFLVLSVFFQTSFGFFLE